MFLLMFKLGILYTACVSITIPPNYPNTAYGRCVNKVREDVIVMNGIFSSTFSRTRLCAIVVKQNEQNMYKFLTITKNIIYIYIEIPPVCVILSTLHCQIKHMR